MHFDLGANATLPYSARDVRRREFWKNQRILALSVFVGLVSLFFSIFPRDSTLLPT
jgi:hypothetical protein